MKYLKKIRVGLSLLFFIPILLFFLDFTGKLPTQLHQLLSIQWIPALLSMDFIILGVLLLLSLLFGRIYCSVICPLGVFQDIVTWKTRLFRKKKEIPLRICQTTKLDPIFHFGTYYYRIYFWKFISGFITRPIQYFRKNQFSVISSFSYFCQ